MPVVSARCPPAESASHDDAVDVDAVFLRVLNDPAERAPAILHRSGSRRNTREPVLYIHHVHAHFEDEGIPVALASLVPPVQPPP
jgi:hypothetical protein